MNRSAIALSRDGARAWVPNHGSDATYRCWTLKARRVLATIALDASPALLDVSALDGRSLAVALPARHEVALIDAGRGVISGRVALPSAPGVPAVSRGWQAVVRRAAVKSGQIAADRRGACRALFGGVWQVGGGQANSWPLSRTAVKYTRLTPERMGYLL